uniref:Uncharacterized protein n=1 Tax=Lotus japonicus TaxID=34305 RepID=I3SLI2_LOTJA|nr:unknown [Lotus japonicus]
MGMMILMLRSLALMVVQRHTAASKSTSPASTGQQVCLALPPIPMCIRPPKRSTHAPSFKVSIGHVGCAGGGDGTTGGGGGLGVSVGGLGGVTTGGVGVGGVTIGGVGVGGVTIGGDGTTGGSGT